MQIKVLHTITSLNRGGIEKWLLSMLAAVPRSIAEMDVCCKSPEFGALEEQARTLGVRVYHIPLDPTLLGFVSGFRKLLNSNHYDIVHNHLQSHSGLPSLLGRRAGAKVISSFHNTKFNAQTPFTQSLPIRPLREWYVGMGIKYTLTHSDLVTGCSLGVLDALNTDYGKIPVPNRVLYYGVPSAPPISDAGRRTIRQSINLQETDQVLLHVGRFVEQKNHAGLLRIFEHVRAERPSARLVLVGDGPLRGEIERQVQSRGLSPFVSFLGLRDDVTQLMQVSDLFVFPSQYEGFGLVCIEAAAARLPVIATRIAGVLESVRDGENALLFRRDDEAGMARAIIDLLGQDTLVRAMADAGGDFVASNFSMEAAARNLVQTYRSVLGASD